MATIDIWIQIENHAWDTCPQRYDRMENQDFFPVSVFKDLTSPVTGFIRKKVRMYRPLPNDALILRRYTANWAAPNDQKVNPWDINELNPTDTGTMGTIPGPVIECRVGDQVKVHFRNMDTRSGKPPKARAHSLHPHGFVFAPTSDGAYPLSPPDTSQPIPAAEQAAWVAVDVTGNKRGDRVPPGGTFTYTWETLGWPTTAGVWLYHDHSICDVDNVSLGAIGIIVIHNTADTLNEVLVQDLPGGSPNGNPISVQCFPIITEIQVLPHDLINLGAFVDPVADKPLHAAMPAERHEAKVGPPIAERVIQRGDLMLELNPKLTAIQRWCTYTYVKPPTNALYLLLFHELTGAPGMSINGRTFLGNTPTLIAGTDTRMRFGVVGMGSQFHTFHLHGHRWIIPGPDGNTPETIQGNPEVKAVSQFEDTRTFGPANSFVFTVSNRPNPGPIPSFMRAGGAAPTAAKGEWHMHCHVLNHMMPGGMMGSLLIVEEGDFAGALLPRGEKCPPDVVVGPIVNVTLDAGSFSPVNPMITVGQTVRWTNTNGPHTVTSNTGGAGCNPVSAEAFDSNPGFPANPLDTMGNGATFEHTFNVPGTYAYHCKVHGCGMAGTIMVS